MPESILHWNVLQDLHQDVQGEAGPTVGDNAALGVQEVGGILYSKKGRGGGLVQEAGGRWQGCKYSKVLST